MNTSYDKNAAIVVLPPVSGGRLRNKSLRTWLARSSLTQGEESGNCFTQILPILGWPVPEHGLAALRMWGQTGDRPTMWIAAADPIYLEPRLNHVCLHELRSDDVSPAEMRSLVDHLQATLALDQSIGFICLGSCSYLSAKAAIATADDPACFVDQQPPNDFLPSGSDSATHRKLIGEIEMALHEHEVNIARVENGRQPINSLWLWGGGTAPEQKTRRQPPLFSDDALLSGYWYAATAVSEPWPGDIATCLEDSVAGFVAIIPTSDDRPELLENCLLELRQALRERRLSRLILLFRDGLRAVVERKHAYRFWRRDSDLLRKAAQ